MIFIIITWIIIGLAGWRVFSRAGFEGHIGLLFLIPIANFFALLYLAYTDWPVFSSEESDR
jgi:hypothetical protein